MTTGVRQPAVSISSGIFEPACAQVSRSRPGILPPRMHVCFGAFADRIVQPPGSHCSPARNDFRHGCGFIPVSPVRLAYHQFVSGSMRIPSKPRQPCVASKSLGVAEPNARERAPPSQKKPKGVIHLAGLESFAEQVSV